MPRATSFLCLHSLPRHPQGFQYYPNIYESQIYIGSSSFSFQAHVIYCWLDISTWLSHRHHILNLPKIESLPPFFCSHNLPLLRKWPCHSSSWLDTKPWNYPCLFFFSPFHMLYPVHRKFSQLYIKIHPKSNHFSPYPTPSVLSPGHRHPSPTL